MTVHLSDIFADIPYSGGLWDSALAGVAHYAQNEGTAQRLLVRGAAWQRLQNNDFTDEERQKIESTMETEYGIFDAGSDIKSIIYKLTNEHLQVVGEFPELHPESASELPFPPRSEEEIEWIFVDDGADRTSISKEKVLALAENPQGDRTMKHFSKFFSNTPSTKEPIMARPIAETPVLYGEDARRLWAAMQNPEPPPPGLIEGIREAMKIPIRNAYPGEVFGCLK